MEKAETIICSTVFKLHNHFHKLSQQGEGDMGLHCYKATTLCKFVLLEKTIRFLTILVSGDPQGLRTKLYKVTAGNVLINYW